jgi:formylmethanofuran dehydrogenase subunit D
VELNRGEAFSNRGNLMVSRRFILNPSRTAKQGALINSGKDTPEYKAVVTTLTMDAADMKEMGIESGDSVIVRTEFGEAIFQCEPGKCPTGLLFVPYGPPTCKLMGGDTDGTGMPTSKGWDVDVEPVPK